MNDIKEFLVSGGKEGRIEYLRINRLTAKPYIDTMSYYDFMQDCMSDEYIVERHKHVLSGEMSIDEFINTLVQYATYHYQDEVDNFRKYNEAY